MLKTNSVLTPTIQDNAVTTPKLAVSLQNTITAAINEVTQDKQWIIAGTINVAAADVDYIGPAYIPVPTGHSVTITTLRARINSGTNVNLRMTRNGTNLPGLTNLTVTPAGISVTGLSLTLTDGDLIAPVVNSTSGGPQNMTVMISYKITKT